MMIGIFVLAAFAIIISIMLFLHPNIGDDGQILRVRFADIDKISPGTRVNFGGKPIGEVLEIKEIRKENGDRIERDGIIYAYELTLALDSNFPIYQTDEITSKTSGLLGERSVLITPMPAKKGYPLERVKGQILYAEEGSSIESSLKEFKALSNKIETSLDGIIEILNTLKEQKVWENMATIMENIADITTSLNQPEKYQAILNGTNAILQNLEETTIAINQPQKITKIIDNVFDTSVNISEMTNIAKTGEGSLGKILVKDDFYLRLSSLLSKGEVVLDDMNHYGVLFHLDKGWQRLRARRLNLLSSLSNPQEFRNYFNDEVDAITTSLERISMVIEHTTNSCSCWNLWQNPEYVKVYGELLRRVTMFEENLQMYNRQVVEAGEEQIKCYK